MVFKHAGFNFFLRIELFAAAKGAPGSAVWCPGLGVDFPAPFRRLAPAARNTGCGSGFGLVPDSLLRILVFISARVPRVPPFGTRVLGFAHVAQYTSGGPPSPGDRNAVGAPFESSKTNCDFLLTLLYFHATIIRDRPDTARFVPLWLVNPLPSPEALSLWHLPNLAKVYANKGL